MRARAQVASFAFLLLAGCNAPGRSPFFEPASPYEVIETVPGNDAAGVALDVTVEAEFGAEIDPSGAQAGGFQLFDGSDSLVPGAVSLSGRVMRFAPSGLLVPGTQYRVVVEGMSDQRGRPIRRASWIFTTRALPPATALTARTPEDGRTGVPVNFLIRIGFSEPLDESTVPGVDVAVSQDGAPLAGETRYEAAARALVFRPGANASDGVDIDVTVDTAGLLDTYGRAVGPVQAWSFATGAAFDVERPVLQGDPVPVETPAGTARVQVPDVDDPDWPGSGGFPLEILYDAVIAPNPMSICGDPAEGTILRAAGIGPGPIVYPGLAFGRWVLILEAEDGAGRRSIASPPVPFDITAGEVRFAAIEPILESRCVGCHPSADSPGGIDLSTDAAGLTSQQSSFENLKQVEPFCLQNSYLYRKIQPGYDMAGEIMPPEHVDVNALSRGELELFRQWILQGAQQ